MTDETTTISITKAQKAELDERKQHERESYKSVISRLLDGDGEVPNNAELDTEALVSDLVDEIGATVGGTRVDDSEIAREVTRQIDYVELADRVSEQVARELGGGR